jgi:hypothetical protein
MANGPVSRIPRGVLRGKKFYRISERLLSKMSTMSVTAETLARFGHDPALDSHLRQRVCNGVLNRILWGSIEEFALLNLVQFLSSRLVPDILRRQICPFAFQFSVLTGCKPSRSHWRPETQLSRRCRRFASSWADAFFSASSFFT